jgi:hypothetical protein
MSPNLSPGLSLVCRCFVAKKNQANIGFSWILGGWMDGGGGWVGMGGYMGRNTKIKMKRDTPLSEPVALVAVPFL